MSGGRVSEGERGREGEGKEGLGAGHVGPCGPWGGGGEMGLLEGYGQRRRVT